MKIYHTETQEDYRSLMNEIEELGGCCWGAYGYITPIAPTELDKWELLKGVTCVRVDSYDSWDILGFDSVNGYQMMFPEIRIEKYNAGDKIDEMTIVFEDMLEGIVATNPSHNLITSQEDSVNSPAHYNKFSQEVIDLIEERVSDYPKEIVYHVGNAIKYIMRAPFKGKLKEDLKKAVWYLNRAIDILD